MGRQVNIALRGTLEELPEEIAEFLMVLTKKMEVTEAQMHDVIERLENKADASHCLVDIDNIRKHLFKIDNRLHDCSSILTGYLHHLNNPDEATPPEGSSTAPAMDDGEE